MNIFSYFESQANTGEWDELYNIKNPASYPFIIRLQKTINLLNDIQNKKVCDLGCGTGVLLPIILKKKGIYVGIDFSKEMIQVMEKKYSQEILKNNIRLTAADFKDFNENEKFDILVGLGFIEYFDEPEVVIQKLYQILNNNGQIIISFPNANSMEYFLIKSTSKIRSFIKETFKIGKPQPERKMWTKKDALNLLRGAGFKNIEVENYFVNLIIYPFKVIFPKFAFYVARKLENSWISKFDLFVNGFIISARK